jgi:hypothetical protein
MLKVIDIQPKILANQIYKNKEKDRLSHNISDNVSTHHPHPIKRKFPIRISTERPSLQQPKSQNQIRYMKLLDNIKNNKYKFLVEMPDNIEELKRKIYEEIDKNLSEKEKEEKLEYFKKASEYVDEFYRGIYRKDKITLASAHIYQVAYGTISLGCRFDSLLASLFHDVKEDALSSWSKKTQQEVNDDILRLFSSDEKLGKRVIEKVNLLTHDKKKDNYRTYLEKIYQSGDLELMVIKAVDMIRNLSTLYFEGCEQELRERVSKKALTHVEIWKKLNRHMFELMLELIKNNTIDASDKVDENIKARIDNLKRKSLRQKKREDDKVVMVNWRGEVNLSLLSDIPDSGSPVITIYVPRYMIEDDQMEIEFPIEAGSAEEIGKKLKKAFKWLEFEKVESKLPPKLVCTTIFRFKTPEESRHEEFLRKIKRMASKLQKELKNNNQKEITTTKKQIEGSAGEAERNAS